MVSNAFRFGVFELDIAARELRKSGIRVKLEQQPLEVLLLLLERAGEVVTRDELRAKLWQQDIHVDFDRSLNKAVVKLREALGDLAESPRFIETRPRHGYRFIARVERNPETPALAGSPRSKKRGTLMWATCSAAVLLATGGVFWSGALMHSAPAHVGSLAVLPLRNLSSDPDQEYLASGITEVLTTGLAQLGAFDVIASTSALRYRKTDRSAVDIAHELNVDALVEGSVQRTGSRVLVTAQLIDGTTARQLWARSYDRDFRDTLSLQGEIADAIADEISSKLGPRAHARVAASNNPEAQDAFLRAQFLSRRNEFARSFVLYQEAIEKDPHFAAAYAGLPYGYVLSDLAPTLEEALVKWRAGVKRALELDPNLDDAHRAYANMLGYAEWNWRETIKEYQIAIRLNPNLAVAHQNYGMMLAFMGRAEEGVRELRRAQRLDPASSGVGNMLGLALWYARRGDELLVQAKRVEDLDARWAALFRGYAHELKGEYDQAVRDLSLAPEDNGAPVVERYIVGRARVYAALGKTREARNELAELTRLSQKRKVRSWWFACAYAAVGDKDRAFELLEKAFHERPGDMISFAATPEMDPLRQDPRFEDMLRRMDIPRS